MFYVTHHAPSIPVGKSNAEAVDLIMRLFARLISSDSGQIRLIASHELLASEVEFSLLGVRRSRADLLSLSVVSASLRMANLGDILRSESCIGYFR